MTYLCTLGYLFIYITIFIHNVDFMSDHTQYIIFETYHFKYTDFSSIVYLDTFSVHTAVKSPVLNTLYNKLHI